MITEQKEVKFWQFMKAKLSKARVDMQRIENTTGSGVPDVNMCFKGTDAWIELKVYVKGNVVLRKEQYAWLTKRAFHDGNVLVAAWNEDEKQVEFFAPPFNVRVWGTNNKYVAITNEPEVSLSKTAPVNSFLMAIFEHL